MYSVDSTVTSISPPEWQHSKESVCCQQNITTNTHTDGLTEAGQSAPNEPLCFTGDAKINTFKWWYIWCQMMIYMMSSCGILLYIFSPNFLHFEICCKREYIFLYTNQICLETVCIPKIISQYIGKTRGPKGHISCTWVQYATFLTDWPGRPSCFSDQPKKTQTW